MTRTWYRSGRLTDPEALALGHRGDRGALGLLVDRGHRAVALHLAEVRVQVLDERAVALLHGPRAVLHVQRLLDRRLLELAGVRLRERGEQVVLDHGRVRAAGRDLQERRGVVRERRALGLLEDRLDERLVGRALERRDRLR